MPEPTKDQDAWACPDGFKFCGNAAATNAKKLACVPEAYMCPINKVEFTSNVLSTKTDDLNGSPLVDIKLSQGGAPCINMKSEWNSITVPKKEYLRLNPESYYEDCSVWRHEGKTFKESTNHQQVDGWLGVSEYDILNENEAGGHWYDRMLDTLMLFRSYDLSPLHNYKYTMYSRSYQDW